MQRRVDQTAWMQQRVEPEITLQVATMPNASPMCFRQLQHPRMTSARSTRS